jgi:hypothetical protein
MVISTICFPELSFATREDFLKETLGYRTLRFGELEPEYWLDIWVGPLGRERHFGHSLAFEYGFTERCMMDARATLRSGDTRALIFESGRVELRYRLPQDKSLLADIALSAELNTERTDQGEYEVGIEPRIIFSREVGKLEAPLNLAVEIGLESESPEFNPSFGVRYALLSVIQWGLEARYNATSRLR